MHSTFFKEHPPQLSDWINKYGKDYVAHAIWKDNVTKVLSSGSLTPAEAQVRAGKTVSYEAGAFFGSRGELNIERVLQELKARKVQLPKLIKIVERLPLRCALELNFIDEATFDKYSVPTEDVQWIALNDGNQYQLLYRNGNAAIEGIPYPFACSSLSAEIDGKSYYHMMHSICEALQVYEYQIQIALDMQAQQKVDQRLAPLYEKYKRLALNNDYRIAWLHLMHCREAEIYSSKLNNNIRGCYNGIAWSYGDVVILVGNTAKVISYVNTVRSDYDAECKKIEEIKLEEGQEVSLLLPFENGGEFFSLPLAHPGVIVIGPKHILSQYADKHYQQFCIEDMTKDELDFFHVPKRLSQLAQAARVK